MRRMNSVTNSILYESPFSMLSKTTGLDSYAANFPCEDREALIGFEEVRGGAIFDGHGGWKISDFLSRYIHPTLLKHYSEYRNEATVS